MRIALGCALSILTRRSVLVTGALLDNFWKAEHFDGLFWGFRNPEDFKEQMAKRCNSVHDVRLVNLTLALERAKEFLTSPIDKTGNEMLFEIEKIERGES